jgi:NADPH-dependent curcumin reductase CurA
VVVSRISWYRNNSHKGLLDIGNLKSGETLIVSGAAGSVGSVACQIGKIKGAKVVGIAGGPEKCAWLKDEVGVDVALDYKSPSFHDEYKESAGFADVFFDNVGGEILNFVMTRMAMKGRIVCCGMISTYSWCFFPIKSTVSLIWLLS